MKKYPNSLIEDAMRLFPGGVLTSYTPPESVCFVPEHGNGSRLYDVNQREYLDYTCGQGVLLLGHAHPSINEAVRRQLDKGSWLRVYPCPATIELAGKIVNAVPCADKVAFVNSGSEATLHALRISRAYTGKSKILKYEGAYHGHHDCVAVSIKPEKLADFPAPYPETAGIPPALLQDVLVAPFNDLEKTEEIVESHKHDLAAIIVEPVQRTISPQPGFLEGLREITKTLGICLIFDEVVTGFRLSHGGAQELYGIIPDLATFGKGLGGGYPIGAICGKREIMELCNPFHKAPNYVLLTGTFNGNPIVAAASLAVIKEMEKPGAYERLNQMGERLMQGLRNICEAYKVPAQVTGKGSIWHIYFTGEEIIDYRSTLRSDENKLRHFHLELIRNGILPIFMTKGYICLAHTKEEIDLTLDVMDMILSKMK